MTPELDTLLSAISAPGAHLASARYQFGLACCQRVRHLLEHPEGLSCVDQFQRNLQTAANDGELAELSARIAELARSHQGSRSIDGVGHAAVSATYACAAAMGGKPRQAAEYTTYALVYAQGGYGAVGDPESFVPEHNWLVGELRSALSPNRKDPSCPDFA